MSAALIVLIIVLFVAYTLGIGYICHTRGKGIGYSAGVRDTRLSLQERRRKKKERLENDR